MTESLNRTRFLQHVAQTSDFPPAMEFVKADGVRLFDANGRAFLDLISGISVNNLGHHHPEITAAIHEQVDRHLHLMVYGEFVVTPQVEYATKLASLLPPSLSSVYFTNSGAEAIEGAMKLAKRFTGRTEIAGFVNSYHGSTQGALSVTGDPELQRNFRPLLPDILHLRYNHPEDLSKITSRTACLIMEPVQAEAGCLVPNAAYLNAVRERCTQTGTLLIFDEIQTGMGRTGTLFAFQDAGVVPDVLVTGKAFGGGMPLGAFIADKKLMSVLTNHPVLGHITTFGGHPVCCAAGKAALEVIVREQLYATAEEKGQLFKTLLVHPAIREVSGKGLLLAVRFDSYEINKSVIDHCMAHGLITDWFLFAPDCLRIAPPLIITEAEIREACAIILSSLSTLTF
jgi:acetylornithine/succinyldiaminopimelate/putrescine aminotransferase